MLEQICTEIETSRELTLDFYSFHLVPRPDFRIGRDYKTHNFFVSNVFSLKSDVIESLKRPL